MTDQQTQPAQAPALRTIVWRPLVMAHSPSRSLCWCLKRRCPPDRQHTRQRWGRRPQFTFDGWCLL